MKITSQLKLDGKLMNSMKKWKPNFEIFSEVTLLNLGLGEDEESPWFPEGKNIKYQNGFFTIDSVDREIFRSILRFEIGWEETDILQFVDFGR